MKSGVSHKKSPNELLLELIGTNRPQEIPPGWMSVQEMSKQTGISLATTESRIKILIAKGKVQRKQFRVCSENGSVRPVWYYAPAGLA